MLASWYLLLGFGDLGGPAPDGAREVIELVAPIETAVAFSSAIAEVVLGKVTQALEAIPAPKDGRSGRCCLMAG